MGSDTLLLTQKAKQNVLGADIVVIQVAGLFHRVLDDLFSSRSLWQLAHGDHLRPTLDKLFYFESDLAQVDDDGAFQQLIGGNGLDTVRLEGNGMLLTFDQAVRVDDFGSEIEGFSIADESGVFYMANAIAKRVKERELQNKQIFVTSPLVKQPVAE